MYIFAREPVFNADKTVYAYQFIYKNGMQGSFPIGLNDLNDDDEHKQGLSIDELLQVNKTIVNLQPDLLDDFITKFASNEVIIEISELYQKPNPEYLSLLKKMKTLKFAFLLHEHQLHWPELVDLADYLKVSIEKKPATELTTIRQQIAPKNIKIIATKVQTQFQFEQCVLMKADLIQGFFFLDSHRSDAKQLPANKLAYLQLMAEIAKPTLDIGNLESIFQKDPTLSFLLIKFINNPLVNKSHKITSIRHAINYLGEIMMRRFVAIVSLAGLNARQPQELLNLSLSRAKFCELLDAKLHGKNDAMSAFLVGLFSLIDIILNKPLQHLLETLELDDKILKALLQNSGPYAKVLLATKSIESADWDTMFKLSKELKLTKEELFENHRQAVRWQYQMMSAVSPLFPVAQAKGSKDPS